jgi:hypothetical protein
LPPVCALTPCVFVYAAIVSAGESASILSFSGRADRGDFTWWRLRDSFFLFRRQRKKDNHKKRLLTGFMYV